MMRELLATNFCVLFWLCYVAFVCVVYFLAFCTRYLVSFLTSICNPQREFLWGPGPVAVEQKRFPHLVIRDSQFLDALQKLYWETARNHICQGG